MTISATGRKFTSACDGVTTIFTCPIFREVADLQIYLLDAADDSNQDGVLLNSGSDYMLTGDGPSGTAQVTTLVAYPAGKYLRRWRRTSRAQTNHYVPNDGFPAASQEAALDRVSLVTEEHDDDISGTVRGVSAEALDPLPKADQRANKVLLFTGDGQPGVSEFATAYAGAQAVICDSRAVMAAMVGMNDGQAVILSELGREGIFVWDTASHAAEAAADTRQALFVAPAADPTGATGAWYRITDGELKLSWFGVDRTGVNSAVPAFNAAIAWMNYKGAGTGGAYAGVECLIADGQYKIDAALDPISKSACGFRGISRAAVLNLSSAASTFTWNNNAWGGGLGRMTLQYPANPANTAAVVTISAARDQAFDDLEVYNFNTLAVLGTAAIATASAIWFRHLNGYAYNSGKPTFDCRYGSALFLNDVSSYVNGVPPPALDRVSVMATVAGTRAIACTNGGWDTIILSGGCNFNRYDSNLYVNAPGSVISNIWLGDSIFDYTSSDNVALHAATNATGGIFHVNGGSAYIVSWSGYGIALSGDNPNAQHDFSRVNIYIAGKSGIDIAGAATRNIKIHGARIGNVNRLVGNYSGIEVHSILGHFSIVGTTVLDDPSGVFGWSATYGITIAPNVNFYSVRHNECVGTTKNYNIATDATTSPDRQVCDNLRADYAGFKTGGLFVAPASGNNWVNKSPFTVEVTVAGMDLGLGKNDANGNHVDFAPATSGGWVVRPGEQLFVAYSNPVAIKMHWDVFA